MNKNLIEFTQSGSAVSFYGPQDALVTPHLGGGISSTRAFDHIVTQAMTAGLVIGISLPFIGTLVRKMAEFMDIPIPGSLSASPKPK